MKGRPGKYITEFERKKAHRLQQQAYRKKLLQEGKKMLDGSKESFREYSVTLPIGSLSMLREATQKANSDLLSQVIEITNNYAHAKKSGKIDAENVFLRDINDLCHL